MAYTTPGVYVEEVSKIPPSVASVATAVPGFVGYTKSPADGEPVRIESLLDFEEKFGGAIALELDDESGNLKNANCVLYDSIRLFYDNGGSVCYVAPLCPNGDGDIIITDADCYVNAINKLEAVDEVTILLAPDAAINLADPGRVYTAMLNQCGKLMDRVAILDVQCGDKKDYKADMAAFHNACGTNNLSYGAAYYPYLKTAYTKSISFEEMYKDPAVKALYDEEEIKSNIIDNTDAESKKYYIKKAASNADYQTIVEKKLANANIIPPSGAIAGVYSANDAKKGVWQAPANISLSSVSDITVRLSDTQHGDINVNADNGKSVNAIRAFQGKGILVWGARTLDGFSNEWRYISVRRLFNYIEESVKKSTSWAVFQPNDANTWANVRCQIENFLSNLWRDGALAGSTTAEAFRVNVGLNTTMTSDDIYNGIMNVEIAIAAVRPAEFIVLKFSHKVQES